MEFQVFKYRLSGIPYYILSSPGLSSRANHPIFCIELFHCIYQFQTITISSNAILVLLNSINDTKKSVWEFVRQVNCGNLIPYSWQ